MRLACAAVLTSLLALPAMAADVDWNKVDQTLGRKGAIQPDDVHRYGLPRTDLQVTLDGVPIKPALALGGWLAFKTTGSDTMVMGDLVLTEPEINSVMTRLLADHISITAVHNHLLRAQPATFYMHILGHGDPAKLATSLHDALTTGSKTPHGSTPAPSQATSSQVDLDTAML